MTRTHETCRHCGFGVPADAPLCPGCSRPAIDDWKRRARAIGAVERRARRLPPPLGAAGYRSLLRLASLARASLLASAAVGTCAAALHAATAATSDGTTAGTGFDIATASKAATAALLVSLLVTGAAFVAWAVRAYRNLPALGITDRRYWTIWLVIGWVIPGANLLVPKLLVADIWRASSPAIPLDGGDRWQRRPVASIVNRWWCSFLLTPAVAVLAVAAAQDGWVHSDQRLTVGAACVAASAGVVVAAAAARRLVAVVTVAQARRADAVHQMREDDEAAAQHRLALYRAIA